MLPSVIFVTVHKGASTYIADTLSNAMRRSDDYQRLIRFRKGIIEGRDPAQMRVPSAGVVVSRVYPNDLGQLVEDPPCDPAFADKQLVLLYRDPRDVAVSLYYSKAFSHPVNVADPEKFLEERAELQDLGVVEGVRQRTWKGALGEFRQIRRIESENPQALSTRYEDLVSDPELWVATVGKHLGWSTKTASIVHRASAKSFEPPTDEDVFQHKRRITPGNWREIFDEDLIAQFQEAAGDQLAAAGYGFD